MKSTARRDTWPRFNMLMFLVLFLRKIQRHGAVSFAVDKLLHFGIGVVPNFIWCALRNNTAVAEHDHARRDTKGAGHIVGNYYGGHVSPMRQFQSKFVNDCGHDWI